MSTENTNVEVTAEVKPIVTLDLHETATKIAAGVPGLKVRATNSKGYRCIVTEANEDLNWKKGLFFQLNPNAKGFVFELELYSVKGGAHLAEVAPRFAKFASTEIACLKKGFACRLSMKLPFALGEEAIVAKAVEMINLVNPEVEAVRAELKDEDFVSKKESKAKAPVAAEAPAAEAPTAEPTTPEAPAPQAVAKAAKKNHGKRK